MRVAVTCAGTRQDLIQPLVVPPYEADRMASKVREVLEPVAYLL